MPTLCLVEVTQLRTKAVDGRRALFTNKKQTNKVKNITFRPLTTTCVARFPPNFEVVRAIILGRKRFWVQSIVLPLGGVENLAEIAPI